MERFVIILTLDEQRNKDTHIVAPESWTEVSNIDNLGKDNDTDMG
jgi:hypothetical protein